LGEGRGRGHISRRRIKHDIILFQLLMAG